MLTFIASSARPGEPCSFLSLPLFLYLRRLRSLLLLRSASITEYIYICICIYVEIYMRVGIIFEQRSPRWDATSRAYVLYIYIFYMFLLSRYKII